MWPALFASTLTTIIVFLPVIFMENMEGQLFADLALTISVAIAVSLIMAVTVLPVAAARWLKSSEASSKAGEWPRRLGDRMAALTDSPRQRQITIALCLIAPALLTWFLLPPIDYLPPVKRDAIDGFFQFPPGMNVDAIETEVVKPMVRRLAPYMAGEKEPKLKNYYILIFPGGGTIGVRPLDPSKIDELGRLVNEEITAGFPDLQVFAQQGNLFGGFGDGRNIEVRLQSSDFDALLASARAAQDIITEKMPGAQVRSFQDLELSEPELRLVPDDRRISESGWTRANVATVVRALGDGIWVGEHFDGDRRLDMILRAKGWDSQDALAAVPVATPTGGVVPLGELVRIEPTVGTAGLRRVDGRRTIGINVVPPQGTSLQQAMEQIERDIGPAIQPLLPPDGGIRYAGDAGSLETALADMRVNIGLALLVLFLLMAALFRSLEGQRARAADRAARESGRRARHPVPEPVYAADARHADDGRLHHPAGRRCQQRDPAGRQHAIGGARRHGSPQRRARRAGAAHAPDLRDLARPARGPAADDRRARAWRRALSRARHRHRGRHAGQYFIHAGAAAGIAASRRTGGRMQAAARGALEEGAR